MATILLLISFHICFSQVRLGSVTVPRDHIIVFIGIGHSNMHSAWVSLIPKGDSALFFEENPRIWNFNIADQYNGGPNHAWIPAKEPIHQRNSGITPAIGPAMPFLKDLLAKLPPDYYLGVIQNAEGRAELKRHYLDDQETDYGTHLYSQIRDAILALDTTVTWGGVYTMIGLLERTDQTASNNFALNMDTFALRLRALTKTPQLPLLVSQYEKGSTQEFALSLYYAKEIVRQIDSIPSFVPFSRVIPTDWTVDSATYLNDAHHFNPTGIRFWADLAAGIYDSAGFIPSHFRDSIPPTAPSRLSIDEMTRAQAFLSWENAYDNVGCRGYRVTSSHGCDTFTSVNRAVVPIAPDSLSITVTVRAVDLSMNESQPVSVHRTYSSVDDVAPPDSLRLEKKTYSSLSLRWAHASEPGKFLLRIADSLVATTDSNHCTVLNLLPSHVYPLSVAFQNSKGIASSPTSIVCTTSAIRMASVPLYVDFAGASKGVWVADNRWCDSVGHGMVEQLAAASTPVPPSDTAFGAVMTTFFEGQMHYFARVPRDEYICTAYLFDPLSHSPARSFNVLIEGASRFDTLISSPGLLDQKPWSAVVAHCAVVDSIVEFSFVNASSPSPIASGISLARKPPFAVSVTDSASVGDTIRIRWVSNRISVGNAIIKVSLDAGKSWRLITDKSISAADPLWGNYSWLLPATLGGRALAGGRLLIKVADYNELLSATASCQVRNSSRIGRGALHCAGPLRVEFDDRGIRFKGDLASGVVRIYTLGGRIERFVRLRNATSVDFGNLPTSIHIVSLSIDGNTILKKVMIK
jgi:hypothetical protein